MKLYKQIIFIIIIFFKTETLFSENNLFNVNNIELEKKDKLSNNELADKAIYKGFKQLISRILLDEDRSKLSDLNFSTIKKLVTYYQITNISNEKDKKELVSFSVTFDKDKIHNLFYKRGIYYSEVSEKELYILPVLIKGGEIFIFNNNFFYNNWNEILNDDLIEFILPLENIEIIRNINQYKENLIEINVKDLFNDPRDVALLCESASLPSKIITSFDYAYKGYKQNIKIPSGCFNAKFGSTSRGTCR